MVLPLKSAKCCCDEGEWRERVNYKGGGGRGLDPAGFVSCLIKSYLPSRIIKPISPSGAKFKQTYKIIRKAQDSSNMIQTHCTHNIHLGRLADEAMKETMRDTVFYV